MDSESASSDTLEPSAEDLSVAESVIARMDAAPEQGTPKYEALLQGIASMRRLMDPVRFAIRYGLREPQGWSERLEVRQYRGEISETEFCDLGAVMIKRPIDSEMLAEFCDGYESRLCAYSDLLQTVIGIATDQHDAESWRRREPEVDDAVQRMDAKLRLFSDEMETVYRFLTELRAEKGEPVRCGIYTGDNAHWLADYVLDIASRAWKSYKETAKRSRTDWSYVYPTTASNLFYQAWIDPGKLPMPNDMAALMRLERAAAERALRERAEPKREPTPRIEAALVEVKSDTVNIQSAIAKAAQGAVGGDTDWRDVQRRLLELRERGERYTSIGDLAQRLGCSNATMQKAIKPPQSSLGRLPEASRAEASSAARKLAGWQARYVKTTGAPRATSINDIVTDNAEQAREADPAQEAEADDVDIVFNRLIQEAQPKERAQLNRMSDDDRLRLVALVRNDPNKYDRIMGRRP